MKMKMLRREVLEYIEEKDLSITQFAKVCDVSQSAMRGYMQYTIVPSVEAALRIAKVLDKTVEGLWG